jgi:homogentisate 1,2-dioxygenase
MDYLTGFGNHFESEAENGALPQGQNSPKVPLKGLVPEQLTGTAFTMERHKNLRTWLYRIHPSTFHGQYQSFSLPDWQTEFSRIEGTPPSQFRWQPLPQPQESCDFLEGVKTMVTTNTPAGVAVSHYCFNRGMDDRYFYNADAEMIFVPEKGGLEIRTEIGVLLIEPQEIAVVPRGMKFQVNTTSSNWCRGYMAENTGAPFVLPNLGPLGANALAHPRDFQVPVASYEQKGDCQVICKFAHKFWCFEQITLLLMWCLAWQLHSLQI